MPVSHNGMNPHVLESEDTMAFLRGSGALGRLKNPKKIIPKIVRRRRAIRRLGSRIDSSRQLNNLLELLDSGFLRFENCLDPDLIASWKDRYGIKESNFVRAEGNISFPFFNAGMHGLLGKGALIDLLQDYYRWMYGSPPILQMIPALVVTYPNVAQGDFKQGAHNFPANWHVDFRSEFTIHIPLEEISDKTPHTRYCAGSHTSLLRPAKSGHDSHKRVVRCFGAPGDALMLDVEGWHRGQLEAHGFRAFIQLKFTLGNDLLTPNVLSGKKAEKNVLLAKESTKNYDKLKQQLAADRQYLIEQVRSGSAGGVLKDGAQYYDSYLA